MKPCRSTGLADVARSPSCRQDAGGYAARRNEQRSTQGLLLLAETLRFSAPFSAEQMCATVQASLLDAAHRADDVCLLAVQFTG
jgi:hypothetical protein